MQIFYSKAAPCTINVKTSTASMVRLKLKDQIFRLYFGLDNYISVGIVIDYFWLLNSQYLKTVITIDLLILVEHKIGLDVNGN